MKKFLKLIVVHIVLLGIDILQKAIESVIRPRAKTYDERWKECLNDIWWKLESIYQKAALW